MNNLIKVKINWFLEGRRIEVFEIEEILEQIMGDEFETNLEDDSASLVSFN